MPEVKSDEPIGEEMFGHVKGASQEAAELLGVDVGDKPADLIGAVDGFVFDWQQGKRPTSEGLEEDLYMMLGALWGQQLARALDWEWAKVAFDQEAEGRAVGVFSQDRSLAIYPFHFVYGAMEGQAEVTIELSFSMLVEGSRIPALPAKSYENVMENVRHIVPRS